MTVRRRATIVAAFAALFVTGLLLTAFGGTPSPPLVSERVVVLGESGRIIQGQVGDVVDVQLGDSGGARWRFQSSARIVQVTPVATVGMPKACPPSGGAVGRETAGAGLYAAVTRTGGAASGAAMASCSAAPQALTGTVRLLRLTMIAPGVATVKGWRVQPGAATAQGLPDFVFIVLVKR